MGHGEAHAGAAIHGGRGLSSEIFRPVPGGWGKGGSTNVRLKNADTTTLRSALTLAWNNVAPRSPSRPREKR